MPIDHVKSRWADKIQLVKDILAIVALLTAAFGVNAYFAKASDVKVLTYRFDQKILRDDIAYYERLLYELRIKYGDNCENADDEVRKTYMELERKIEELQDQLNKMDLQ